MDEKRKLDEKNFDKKDESVEADKRVDVLGKLGLTYKIRS